MSPYLEQVEQTPADVLGKRYRCALSAFLAKRTMETRDEAHARFCEFADEYMGAEPSMRDRAVAANARALGIQLERAA